MARELYHKTLVPIGTHHSPQGEVRVTPQRVAHWVNTFQKLKSAGVRFPTPWGHVSTAIPESGMTQKQIADAQLVAKARWNAGYIENLSQDPKTGALVMTGTVPPGWKIDPETKDLINEKDGTAIGEVSAGIANWKDGRGQLHKDVIIHAALVPLPVWAGQDGFRPATLNAAGVELLHTLSTHTASPNMAKKGKPEVDDEIIDETEDVTEPDGDELVDMDADVVDDDMPDEPPTDLFSDSPDMAPDMPPVDPMAPPVDPMAGLPMAAQTGVTEQLASHFKDLGADLGSDVTPQNILDRVLTVLNVLKNQGVTLMPPKDQAASMGSVLDTSVPPGATPGNPPGGMGGPMMMSTDTKQAINLSLESPTTQKVLKKLGDDARYRLKREWDALGKEGLNPAIVEKEKAKVDTFHLSFNPETVTVTCPAGRSRVELAKGAIKSQTKKVLTTTLSTSTDVSQTITGVTPAERQNFQEDAKNRFAQMMGGTAVTIEKPQ